MKLKLKKKDVKLLKLMTLMNVTIPRVVDNYYADSSKQPKKGGVYRSLGRIRESIEESFE